MGGSSLGKKWLAPACVMTAQRSVWWPLRNHENVSKTMERDAINWGWETARNPSGSLLFSLHVPRSPAGGAGGTCQKGSLIPSCPASHSAPAELVHLKRWGDTPSWGTTPPEWPPVGLTSASEPLCTDFTTTALFFSSRSKP